MKGCSSFRVLWLLTHIFKLKFSLYHLFEFHDAMKKITLKDYSILPVVSPSNPSQLIGVLTRGDIFSAYNKAVIKKFMFPWLDPKIGRQSVPLRGGEHWSQTKERWYLNRFGRLPTPPKPATTSDCQNQRFEARLTRFHSISTGRTRFHLFG